MINKVTLLGHAGRDIEVRTLENGTKVATVSIATTESYKDKNDEWQNITEWHNIVIWRPSESVLKIAKGDKVYIEGKITSRKYTDRDGVDRISHDIVANVVKNLEKKGSSHIDSITENDAPPF
jgi:single-strand DNA-binding protein